MERQIFLKISDHLDYADDLKRIIGFASEDIVSIQLNEENLVLELKKDANKEEILSNVKQLVARFVSASQNEQIIFSYNNANREYFSESDIYSSDLIRKIDDGLMRFNELGARLLSALDTCFDQIAQQVGCTVRKYPVLLPLESYQSTGYLIRSPQYATFCCDLEENISFLHHYTWESNIKEHLKKPRFALSPSACFHVYDEFKNSSFANNQAFTFTQAVFRNEGRFNWTEYGRLRDYTVRELVFIGSEAYVRECLGMVMDEIKALIEDLNISSTIVTSSDHFVLPEVQLLKRLQIAEKSKYEVRVKTATSSDIACASINYHGTAFSRPFNISVDNCNPTVSGCVGFGLERWCLAFLRQHGINVTKWPSIITSKIKEYI